LHQPDVALLDQVREGKGVVPIPGGKMSLSFLAYNIKRVINIMGVPKMIEALG
jgi:hypothetical protein